MQGRLTLSSLEVPALDDVARCIIAPKLAGLSFVVGTAERGRKIMRLVQSCLDPATPESLADIVGDTLAEPVRIKLGGQNGHSAGIRVDGSGFVLDIDGVEQSFTAKEDLLSGLEGHLTNLPLKCPFISRLDALDLPPAWEELFSNLSEAQQWHVQQDAETRRAVFMQRQEELRTQAEAVREELQQFESGPQQEASSPEAIGVMRERVRQKEAELAESAEALERIESTWNRWQERQTLEKQLLELRKTHERQHRDQARYDELEAQLQGRFINPPSAEALPLDMHLLEGSRDDEKRFTEQLAGTQTRAADVRVRLEEIRHKIDATYSAYVGVSSEFPLHLQLYKQCEEYRRAAESESAVLNEELKGNTAELRKFSQFDQAQADFPAAVKALISFEQEAATQLPPLEAKLKELHDLQEQHAALAAQLMAEFDHLPADWADQLRQLQAWRDEKRMVEEVENLEERESLLSETRPGFLSLTDGWPEDFPEKWSQHREVLKRRLRQDAWDAESGQLAMLESELKLQLESYEGLEKHDHTFPVQLGDLLRMRRDLEGEIVAHQQLEASIAELKNSIEASRALYASPGAPYPAQVEAMRERMAELRGVREQLQGTEQRRSRRQELETQIEAFPAALKSHESLPGMLREHARLRQVRGDLAKRSDPLDDQIRELEAGLAEQYSHVDSTAFSPLLETHRRTDETVQKVVALLDRLTSERSQTDERLAALQSSMEKAEEGEVAGLETEERLLRSQLEWLPTGETAEGLRHGLLHMVATRLDESGIELVVEDYLSYQSSRAALDRLKDDKARLLRTSPTGNDLTRIDAKLQELEDQLGADLMAQPPEAVLAQFEDLARLRRDLQEMGDKDALAHETETLERRFSEQSVAMEAELQRLRITDANDLSGPMARYQEYQGALLSVAALEEAKRARWPDTELADGTVQSELDRRQADVNAFAAKIGAPDVQTAEHAAILTGRWDMAQQLYGELLALRKTLSRLPTAPHENLDDVDLPPSCLLEAEDDLLQWIWDQRQRFESALRGLREEHASLVASRDEANTTPTVDLDEKLEALEQELALYLRDDSIQATVEKIQRDIGFRSDLATLDELMALVGKHDEILAVRQSLQDGMLEGRKALGLTAEQSLPSVLEEYQRRSEIQEQRRLLLRLQAGQDKTIADLTEKMNDLQPRLKGCEKTSDIEAELAHYQKYVEEAEQARLLDELLTTLASEVESLHHTLKDAQQQVQAVEGRLGVWTHDLSIEEIRAAYEVYLGSRDEIKVLREALQAGPVAAEMAAVESRLSELGDQLAPPSGLLRQIEASRRQHSELEHRLRDLTASLHAMEAAPPGTADAPAGDDVQALIATSRATINKIESEMKAVEAALEGIDRQMEEPAPERCSERASELLVRFTRGKYIQMSKDDAGQKWLWAARGGKVALDQAGDVGRCAALCWRLAVLFEVGQDYPWPILLEDPFSAVDASQRFPLLGNLTDLARDLQVIIVTTRGTWAGKHLIVADLDAVPDTAAKSGG